MAAEAREKLKAWANQETTSTFDPLYEKVGAHEGCGGLLRIAVLDPTGSGQLTEAAVSYTHLTLPTILLV